MDKLQMGPQTLLYPMPAMLVGANVDGKPNFMAVAWGVPELVPDGRRKTALLAVGSVSVLFLYTAVSWAQAGRWRNTLI